MKRLIKNPIFMFILGALIFGFIGVIAANEINANQIKYSKNGVDTTVDTVLDDLYTEAGKDIYEYLGTPVYYEDHGTADLERTFNQEVTKGKYLALISEGQAFAADIFKTTNATAKISCTSNNCTMVKISGRFIKVSSDTVNRTVNNLNYLYFIEIKENTDTLSISQTSTSATTSNPQYINLTLIPINK